MTRFLLGLSLLFGCAEVSVEPPVEPTGEEALRGVYVGELWADMRAYMGPVRVAHAVCETELYIEYDPQAHDALVGWGDCGILPDFGHIEVEVWGHEVEAPEVGGEYYSEPFTSDWQGWFLDAETLWAVTKGKGRDGAYRVKWEAEMEATWVAPLENAESQG